MIQTQDSLFGIEETHQKKKSTKKSVVSQKEQVSPFYEEVMKLGNSYHYKRLEVNGSLIIGNGPEGWQAYASLLNEKHAEDKEIKKAIERRIEEIKRAIQRERHDS